MMMDNLFIKNYNRANNLVINSDLDVYDECCFFFLDILKEKVVVVVR